MTESYEVMTFKPAKSDQTSSTSKLVGKNDTLGTKESVNVIGKTNAYNPKDNLSCESAFSFKSETVSKVEISKKVLLSDGDLYRFGLNSNTFSHSI